MPAVRPSTVLPSSDAATAVALRSGDIERLLWSAITPKKKALCRDTCVRFNTSPEKE